MYCITRSHYNMYGNIEQQGNLEQRRSWATLGGLQLSQSYIYIPMYVYINYTEVIYQYQCSRFRVGGPYFELLRAWKALI